MSQSMTNVPSESGQSALEENPAKSNEKLTGERWVILKFDNGRLDVKNGGRL